MNPNIDTSYEPFSREPEYIDLNRRFIESIDWRGCRRVIDVACGTGTLTEFVWRALLRAGACVNLRIVGIDVSSQSLQLARQHFASLGVPLSDTVTFVQGSGETLPLEDCSMDAAVMGNAIHIFDDKERLLREIGRVLRPSGLFGFNSSFYAGTFVPGTEQFYMEWMKEALARIRQKDSEQRRTGGEGIVRKKGSAPPAFSRPWLSMEDYEQLLDRCGFEVRSVNQRILRMSRRSFETVGAYAGLATVLLSGYPVDQACEALQRAVAPALATVQMDQVPRYWLEMVATKQSIEENSLRSRSTRSE